MSEAQLFLDLRGIKNHWGPIPHLCPQCGTTVFTDAIMSEVLCDDCYAIAELEWLGRRRA